jgi:hypothetical protein
MISRSRNNRLMLGLSQVLILLALGFGPPCHAGQASDANDLERAKQLVAKYEELEQKLKATIEAAELADPNLRQFKMAREKMKRWYEDDLGPAKRRWVEWQDKQANPKEAEAVFRRLKGLAGAVSFANDMEDPNLGRFIRDTVLPMLIKGAKDPNMVVGPYTTANEKDKDKLWNGFKRFSAERASWCEDKLEQYTQEKMVPKWIVQLASDMSRGESYLMFYKVAVDERRPKEVYEIKKEMLTVCRELAPILPQWNQLRGLPEQEWKKALEQNQQK